MHRFFLPPEASSAPNLSLSERDAHHAAQVLRLRTGDTITVLDGVGHSYVCTIEAISRKQVTARILKKDFTPPSPAAITLLQAIPKGKLFEWIIEKSVELGVTRIVPLLTERTIAQLDKDRGADKHERWQITAIEATKQCGQTWLPKVEAPVTLVDFLKRKEAFELSLVGSLHEGARHPRDFFHQFVQTESRSPASISVFIGPEGDFTPAEIHDIESSGAKPITLGRLVLRCETAAMYCLSVINYEIQGALR